MFIATRSIQIKNAHPKNVVNPALCALLTQLVFFVKTANLRYQSSSETHGQSVGSGKKGATKVFKQARA